jgi:hypothetical protein
MTFNVDESMRVMRWSKFGPVSENRLDEILALGPGPGVVKFWPVGESGM